MSRADEVAQNIREAADHPRASFLFAVGAECPSPQSAASEAYALGLTNKEEKLAKWVAILKRDAEELFGKSFLEALRDIFKEGENEMTIEVKRGKGFFQEKAQPLLRTLTENLLREGIEFKPLCRGDALQGLEENYYINFLWYTDSPGWLTINTTPEKDLSIAKDIFITKAVKVHPRWSYSAQFGDDGFPDLRLQVSDQRAMKFVKIFARAWEAKSKQLKESREATITIYQEFA